MFYDSERLPQSIVMYSDMSLCPKNRPKDKDM